MYLLHWANRSSRGRMSSYADMYKHTHTYTERERKKRQKHTHLNGHQYTYRHIDMYACTHIHTHRYIHINIHIHADILQVKSFIHDLQVCTVQLVFRLYLFLAIFLLLRMVGKCGGSFWRCREFEDGTIEFPCKANQSHSWTVNHKIKTGTTNTDFAFCFNLKQACALSQLSWVRRGILTACFH